MRLFPKYVFRLEENVSRVVPQNSLTPKRSNLNFRLASDQVVLLETTANLCVSRRQANDFLAEGLGETKLTVSLGASH